MDHALALLFVTAALNALVIARSPATRGEKLALLLLQLMLGCVAAGATLTDSVLGPLPGAGRSLLTCAAGGLLIVIAGTTLSNQKLVERFSAFLFAALLLSGLAAETALVTRLAGAWVVVLPCAVAVATAAALVHLSVTRLRAAKSVLQRTRAANDAVAAGLLGLAAGVAGGLLTSHLWAGILAAAAALATARVVPAPPDRRDVAVVVCAFVVSAVVVDWPVLPLLGCAIAVAVVAGRSLLIPPRTSVAVPVALTGVPAPEGLSGVLPLLDDALLRRPGRPRVLARTPARRLLDAALDRAQRAQPQHRGRPPIDVSVGEGEADVDGDPSELAEALCAVLDNALRQQARHPWAKISVVVRAAAQTVSFEVNDTAPDSGHADDVPFMAGRLDDVDRPGLGVSLARARLLIEKHGGQLHARHGPEGSAVHLTLPRRLGRSGVGVS